MLRRINRRESCSYIAEILCNHLYHCPIIRETPLAVQTRCYLPLRNISSRSSIPAQNPEVSVPIHRVSRGARSEAQDALFNYLHSTRGFQFTDAEHISKNSPHFVQSLLSKVENEQNVTRALSKFLRYNPINEFEPFLESLGLSPSEFTSLLPRSLMFLKDDQVMLVNFHVLCDYGIPRSKIGKIYKEANEMLRYDYGILASKLRSYEELGLKTSVVIKLLTCCPKPFVGGVNKEFVEFLGKLNSMGFGIDWIGGHLAGKSTYNWNRMLDTIGFLGDVGYDETGIFMLLKMDPLLLFDGCGKRIYVLVARLVKLGFKLSEIYTLFSTNPQILFSMCVENLWRTVCFLFEIGMETKDIANLVASNMQLLASHSLKRPRTVLRILKVDKDSFGQFIKDNPQKFLSLASKSKPFDIEQVPSQSSGTFPEKTTFLCRLGYVENSEEMTKALKQFRGRGDELQERFDCLVQAGFDCNVVVNMVKQAPNVLNQSKDVLEKKIHCLRNYLNYPLECVVAFPSYLCYDMDRIKRRFSMFVWLKERSGAKPTLSLSTILACSDARFVKYFVNVDVEGPAMWESLKSSPPCS